MAIGISRNPSLYGADTLGLGGGHYQPSEPRGADHLSQDTARMVQHQLHLRIQSLPGLGRSGNSRLWQCRKGRDCRSRVLQFQLVPVQNLCLHRKLRDWNCASRASTFSTTRNSAVQIMRLDKNSADANFGQVTSAYDPRTLQLGAKFHFELTCTYKAIRHGNAFSTMAPLPLCVFKRHLLRLISYGRQGRLRK